LQALRYCTTADGVRLAMRSVGQGPLVIKAANWLGNLELTRHGVSGPMAARYMKAFYEVDARVDAPQVRCPTLVMHVSGDTLIPG
jgi:hypothetical protein